MWPLMIGSSLVAGISYAWGYFTKKDTTPQQTVDNQATCVSALVAQGKTPSDAANMCYGVQPNTSLTSSILLPAIISAAVIFILPKIMHKKEERGPYYTSPVPMYPSNVSEASQR
jgi:hypothetical protein